MVRQQEQLGAVQFAQPLQIDKRQDRERSKPFALYIDIDK